MRNKNKDRKPLKILVVGGHPADAFDNAGGTCLHHTRQGDSVIALILTHGARIHDIVISDELRKRKKMPQGKNLEKLIEDRSEIKKAEVCQACAIMGIKDVRWLTYDDDILLVREQTIRDIARIIREVRPNIIITHYPFDNGGYADQHAITGQCVLHASWVAGSVDPNDPNPPYRIAQMFFMGFPSHFLKSNALLSEFSGHCHIYVDISDVVDLKVKALDKMRSQQYDGDCAWKRVEAVEGSAGFAVRLPYAEPFIVAYSEVYYTLPVSDYRLTTANEEEKSERQRTSFIVTKYGNLKKYQATLRAKRRNRS